MGKEKRGVSSHRREQARAAPPGADGAHITIPTLYSRAPISVSTIDGKRIPDASHPTPPSDAAAALRRASRVSTLSSSQTCHVILQGRARHPVTSATQHWRNVWNPKLRPPPCWKSSNPKIRACAPLLESHQTKIKSRRSYGAILGNIFLLSHIIPKLRAEVTVGTGATPGRSYAIRGAVPFLA